MSKEIKYLTGCLSSAEQLRLDAESGRLLIYDVPSFPTGIIPGGYLDKCSSVAVAVSGSGCFDYLVAMPIRPDKQKSGSMKDIDIDPVIFCFKRDDLEAFPTGVALYHQEFQQRTTPLSGYDAFTVPETVHDLRQRLVTGYQAISASPGYYAQAIYHSISKLESLVGSTIQKWNMATSKSAVAPSDSKPTNLPATPSSPEVADVKARNEPETLKSKI